jgi:hypothetical protein
LEELCSTWTGVQVCRCTGVWAGVQVCDVPVCRCSGVQVCRCEGVQVCVCTGVRVCGHVYMCAMCRHAGIQVYGCVGKHGDVQIWRVQLDSLRPHRELPDDLFSLLQAGLQTTYELQVLRPRHSLPRLLSGVFQSGQGRQLLNRAEEDQVDRGRCCMCLAFPTLPRLQEGQLSWQQNPTPSN